MAPAYSEIAALLADLPPSIDADTIYAEWQAMSAFYDIEARHLPLPVWARRPLEDDGPRAWEILQGELAYRNPDRAFCIYLHIPFCARRCGFCDCYSFKMGTGHEDHFRRYTDTLIKEMRLWSETGDLAQRRISTVHLGGGTPTFLPTADFRRLMRSCQTLFSVDQHTEWALESTTAQLTDEMLPVLDELGFTRLHIGVQSLEDRVRTRIHRQEPADTVIEKIEKTVGRGWVVSVDMIAGLPGQSLAGLLDDLRLLADLSVDGFSLYEMQVSPRNRRFAQDQGLMAEPRLKKYVMIQAAARLLEALGYRKTLFNHFARRRDMNLYFSFPERNEDCLAVGTIADGVFGDYHYRHPSYAAYMRSATADYPGLQGGLRRNASENILQPLTTALLAARIPEALLYTSVPPPLRARWEHAQLLAHQPDEQIFTLTSNGSWLLGNMISERFA
ncbi:MAG: radical SAM protein [Chloroflexi bacterium]|nr:radical SAM protein [Chloroflexota bacterium]